MRVGRTSSWKRKATASSKRSFTSDTVSSGGFDCWWLQPSELLANQIFDLRIRKVIEPTTSQISHSRCMIFQGDFASFVELPDIDARPCFESCLFFVCHRRSI